MKLCFSQNHVTRDPRVCVREREREMYIYICIHVDLCLYVSTLIYERLDFDCIVRVVGVHYVAGQLPASNKHPKP